MKPEDILSILPNTRFPVGLGGCYVDQANFECCAYDITIFDGTDNQESIVENDGKLFRIHHHSLSETSVELLIQFQNMQILSDEQWELQMFLAKIKERQESIFNVFTKNSIIESQICLTKATNGLSKSDPFIPVWIKCAAYFLTDAIIALNKFRPSPTHMLNTLRNFKPSQINKTLSVVLNSIGLERATPSLLERMMKSGIGLSDLIEKNNNSRIIKTKTNCLIEQSLFSDCYFYIGYVNRKNLYSIKDSLDKHPEIIHILKTGFDLEYDKSTFDSEIQSLNDVGKSLLKSTYK